VVYSLLSTFLPGSIAEWASVARFGPFLDAVPMKRVIASPLALEIKKTNSGGHGTLSSSELAMH
jgi:hypothetical protein